MLIKIPVAEAPVKTKNFLSLPLIFFFIVTTIKATPKREKTTNGNRKRREPLNKSLITGTKNWPRIKRKVTTKAPKIVVISFIN